jgi:hypothetical protein
MAVVLLTANHLAPVQVPGLKNFVWNLGATASQTNYTLAMAGGERGEPCGEEAGGGDARLHQPGAGMESAALPGG